MPWFATVLNDTVTATFEADVAPPCKIIDGVPTVRPFKNSATPNGKKIIGYDIKNNQVDYKFGDKTKDDKHAEAKDKAGGSQKYLYPLVSAMLAKGLITGAEPEIAELMVDYNEWKALEEA